MKEEITFECFFLVQQRIEAGETTPSAPSIVSSYPPSASSQFQPDTLLNIPHFCFPDDHTFYSIQDSTKRLESEIFAFILTDLEGKRRFGHTRRIVEPNTAKCLCFISSLPWFDFFEQVTGILEGLQKTSPNAVEAFLKHIQTVRFNPGERLRIEHSTFNKIDAVVASGLSEFGDISLQPLLSSLSVRNILSVLGSIASERRIIMSSNKLKKVSFSVMAFSALLYPFQWQYIFVPLLPQRLLHYCCAPMPFIIGVHASNLIALESMPLEETVFVDLDDDKVVGMDDYEVLPRSSILSALKSGLKHTISSGKKTGVYNTKLVTSLFIQFWAAIFGKYRSFIVDKGNGKQLDRDALVQSLPKSIQKFYEVFSQSQMFEQWSRQCVTDAPNILQFEQEIKRLEEEAEKESSDGNNLNLEMLPKLSKESFINLFKLVKKEIQDVSDQIMKNADNSNSNNSSSNNNKDAAYESEKTDSSPSPIRQMPVRIAIKDILEQQYKITNSKVLQEYQNKYKQNNIYSDLQNTNESKGLISSKSMNELKKRLSSIPMPIPPAASSSTPSTYGSSPTNQPPLSPKPKPNRKKEEVKQPIPQPPPLPGSFLLTNSAAVNNRTNANVPERAKTPPVIPKPLNSKRPIDRSLKMQFMSERIPFKYSSSPTSSSGPFVPSVPAKPSAVATTAPPALPPRDKSPAPNRSFIQPRAQPQQQHQGAVPVPPPRSVSALGYATDRRRRPLPTPPSPLKANSTGTILSPEYEQQYQQKRQPAAPPPSLRVTPPNQSSNASTSTPSSSPSTSSTSPSTSPSSSSAIPTPPAPPTLKASASYRSATISSSLSSEQQASNNESGSTSPSKKKRRPRSLPLDTTNKFESLKSYFETIQQPQVTT